MSSDALRENLRRLDGSAPRIQGAAAELIRHYDKTSTTAVTEWRNALHAATPDQILPLLYTANEVLQLSKRNRGNKFLEAFSPILGPALVHMAKVQPEATEKVRRTVKIWGDRRVFSIRFVNELLQALEPYRTGMAASASHHSNSNSNNNNNNSAEEVEGTFSPPHAEPMSAGSKASSIDVSSSSTHDDIMEILEAHDQKNDGDQNDDDDDDDDDNLFGDDSEHGQKLEIDLDVHAAVSAATATTNSASSSRPKRRRSSASASSSRKTVVLSMTNLLDVWTKLQANQQQYELALHSLKRIAAHTGTSADGGDNAGSSAAAPSMADLENLVGDELQHAVRQNDADLTTLREQRKLLHRLANERYTLGLYAQRYLPWLEAALKQDEDDLKFAQELQASIRQFQPVHAKLAHTRKVVQEEEERNAARLLEQERKRKEQEENERFRQAALSMETEAKPGMVWNPSTREYQSLNTDESWRD